LLLFVLDKRHKARGYGVLTFKLQSLALALYECFELGSVALLTLSLKSAFKFSQVIRHATILWLHYSMATNYFSTLKKGAIRSQLGIAQSKRIPVSTLQSAASKGGKLGKRAQFALNARKFKRKLRAG